MSKKLLFMSAFVSAITVSFPSIAKHDFAIAIHGGAGTILKKNMTPEKQNKYYSSFIVESVPIYWLIVEIGLQILL